MRKLIIGVLLAVLLVAGGLGGVACTPANEYELTPEHKLVGMGFYGTEPFGDETLVFTPTFAFMNPDSVSKITIEHISIFGENGEVWYEGTLLHWREKTPWTEPMQPHETRFFHAFPPVMPMLPDLTGPLNAIAVEIFWSWTDEEGLPLTGYHHSGCRRFDAEGNLIDLGFVLEMHMVNMEHKPKH